MYIASPPLVLAWLLVMLRPRDRSSALLPPPRTPAVPWSGLEIILVVLFVGAVVPTLVNEVLAGTGFLTRLYGENFAQDPSLRNRAVLWLTALTAAPACALILLIPRRLSGTRPFQLGVTANRLRANLFLGVLTAVCVTPFTLTVFLATRNIQIEYFQVTPESHPLEQAAQLPLFWYEWLLLVVSAMVAAPVLEELLFRGLLQRWFASRPYGGPVAVAAAFLWATAARAAKMEQAWNTDGLEAALGQMAPALFVLAAAPLVWASQWLAAEAPGVVGGALLFGAAHSSTWPTPVPLFVLGLGLGVVAYRTRSLIPGLVTHVLFNGVACVDLLFITLKK